MNLGIVTIPTELIPARCGSASQALRDGRLHTGDLSYLDSDGHLCAVDRLKEMITSGRENIYITEAEACFIFTYQ